ncbi:MAG TPA: hypothetical protein ENJ53_04015 [Phaeodactylibacter sp.]|nr:hypothetical protein [Phaeodactylibacter sp.]
MKKYFSKLLLFGEYTVIKGSQALAIPLHLFYGTWKYAKKDTESLQMNLPHFVDYLEKLQNANELLCKINIADFREKLGKGLFFESNIPTGYGVGSSGALCAAVYDVFCENKLEKIETNFLQLKKIFAQIESFFHGASSGADPLVCFVEKPLLFVSNSKIREVDFPKKNKYQFFLLDTKISRKTEPLVNLFLERYEDEYQELELKNKLIPYVDEAIDLLVTNIPIPPDNEDALFQLTHMISHFEFWRFHEMIPVHFRTVWVESLAMEIFKLKLCGAGGGGFLLGVTSDFEKTQETLNGCSLYLLDFYKKN